MRETRGLASWVSIHLRMWVEVGDTHVRYPSVTMVEFVVDDQEAW